MSAERVSAAELKALWFSAEASGMTEDEARGMRVVHMDDGRSYESSIAEIQAARS